LKLIYDSSEIDFYAGLVKNLKQDNQRIYVVPSFTGLGAPY
jgi:glycerol kinase